MIAQIGWKNADLTNEGTDARIKGKEIGIEVVRRGGGEIKSLEGGGWELRVAKAREGWDERAGCELSLPSCS